MINLIVVSFLITGCLGLYPRTSNIIELNTNNFDKFVVNSDEIWIVEFFAPWCGHCKSLVPEYTKAADALKGVIKVGAVNADEHKELAGRFGIRGFPTIKIFSLNKNKPEDYNGDRTAKAIAEAGLAAASKKVKQNFGGSSQSSSGSSDKDVIELTDSNFVETVLDSEDMWLVEFFAPWCGHCKNLAPHWAKAATELKGKVKLGALDATVHTSQASKYGIQGYPTIKFFPAGKKTSSSAIDYDGGRTSNDIIQWAIDKLAENVPAPEIIQFIDEKSFKEACEQKPLCVLSVLPHILDCQSDCRNNYIKILKDLGEKYKNKGWGWIWCEAGTQTDLEEALGLGGFGYPAMTVINIKKMKYSVLRGSYSKDGINEFLRDLSYGRGNTASVRGDRLPTINTVEPWDGKDGELPQEEDIDLSDVSLDDKDEL